MPNWCYTTYYCTGERKELKELLKILKRNSNRKKPRVPNGFGTMWLGCIIDNFGLDWHNYQCRGEITSFDYDIDSITIYQYTAWCEQEGFRYAITEKFPSINIEVKQEEPGMCIYTTTSFDAFPDMYYVETDDDFWYCDSTEELASVVSDIVGKKVDNDLNSINEAIEIYKKDNEDFYISINEFELVEKR